ncbi:D(1)-like dopamine receptor [Ambystoma mexicanum]|uniref:D(1)-like dopamine receptor n=1 Tax=Ambystoma mexicanum TaxID=8296 RepID=UPI0037E86E10
MIPLAVKPNNAGNILVLLFNVCLAAAIVILNVCVFLSIVLERSMRKENRFIYMMSTCVSDFCTGVGWFYVGLFDVLEGYPGKNDTWFIIPSFMGISYLVVLAAQADRYHAVSWPIQYSQRMTPGKTVLVIGCLWFYTCAMTITLIFSPTAVSKQINSASTLISNFITLGIMLGLNIRLYRIAKYQLDREPLTPEREDKRRSLYLIIVVAGSFLLLWTPVYLRVIFCNLMPFPCQSVSNSATDPLAILPRVNAVLTPVLYIRCCSPLKGALFGRLERWCCCRICR